MAGGTTFIFVTDGIEAAFQQAKQAAGDRDVLLAGGASVVQQHLAAGLVDEFEVHIVPATVAQPRLAVALRQRHATKDGQRLRWSSVVGGR
jgi:dihydrofolate reductase